MKFSGAQRSSVIPSLSGPVKNQPDHQNMDRCGGKEKHGSGCRITDEIVVAPSSMQRINPQARELVGVRVGPDNFPHFEGRGGPPAPFPNHSVREGDVSGPSMPRDFRWPGCFDRGDPHTLIAIREYELELAEKRLLAARRAGMTQLMTAPLGRNRTRSNDLVPHRQQTMGEGRFIGTPGPTSAVGDDLTGHPSFLGKEQHFEPNARVIPDGGAPTEMRRAKIQMNQAQPRFSIDRVDHTYRDYSGFAPDEQDMKKFQHISETQDITPGNNFPARLHAILSQSGFSEVVSWLPHGRAWVVLDSEEFTKKVIPIYFQQSKFSSFARQVNGWGFKRLTTGPDSPKGSGVYYHELFLRGYPHLIKWMKRPNGPQKKLASDPENEPNFYDISEQYPLKDFFSVKIGNTDETSCEPASVPSDGTILSSPKESVPVSPKKKEDDRFPAVGNNEGKSEKKVENKRTSETSSGGGVILEVVSSYMADNVLNNPGEEVSDNQKPESAKASVCHKGTCNVQEDLLNLPYYLRRDATSVPTQVAVCAKKSRGINCDAAGHCGYDPEREIEQHEQYLLSTGINADTYSMNGHGGGAMSYNFPLEDRLLIPPEDHLLIKARIQARRERLKAYAAVLEGDHQSPVHGFGWDSEKSPNSFVNSLEAQHSSLAFGNRGGLRVNYMPASNHGCTFPSGTRVVEDAQFSSDRYDSHLFADAPPRTATGLHPQLPSFHFNLQVTGTRGQINSEMADLTFSSEPARFAGGGSGHDAGMSAGSQAMENANRSASLQSLP